MGTAKLKNAITWAARNGINRVDSILTAARGNGKPKKHKQRSPQEPDGDGMNATQRRRAKQYPVADANDPDIKRWLEEQELERQKEAASD